MAVDILHTIGPYPIGQEWSGKNPLPWTIAFWWSMAHSLLQTAAYHDSPWLFPGYTPGQHLNGNHLADALSEHGTPPPAGRIGSWRQLLPRVAPSVLADDLGIRHDGDDARSTRWQRLSALCGWAEPYVPPNELKWVAIGAMNDHPAPLGCRPVSLPSRYKRQFYRWAPLVCPEAATDDRKSVVEPRAGRGQQGWCRVQLRPGSLGDQNPLPRVPSRVVENLLAQLVGQEALRDTGFGGGAVRLQHREPVRDSVLNSDVPAIRSAGHAAAPKRPAWAAASGVKAPSRFEEAPRRSAWWATSSPTGSDASTPAATRSDGRRRLTCDSPSRLELAMRAAKWSGVERVEIVGEFAQTGRDDCRGGDSHEGIGPGRAVRCGVSR